MGQRMLTKYRVIRTEVTETTIEAPRHLTSRDVLKLADNSNDWTTMGYHEEVVDDGLIV